MSGNGETSVGFWVLIISIGALILYFWKEVLTFIGEFILGIFTLANNLLQQILVVALFIGAIYLIVKFFDMFKK